MNLSEDVLFYAFRYTLGRMTYAVHTVASEIITHAHELHPKTRDTMTKEIRKALAEDGAGMDMDRKQWEAVLAKLNEIETGS